MTRTMTEEEYIRETQHTPFEFDQVRIYLRSKSITASWEDYITYFVLNIDDAIKYLQHLQKVTRVGFENASSIARLVYSCEIGDIKQHAIPDIYAILEELATSRARIAELEKGMDELVRSVTGG